MAKTVGADSPVIIETFTSDDDGNLETRLSGGVTTTYTWNDFNKLAATSTPDDLKKQAYTFGVNGFRRKKKDKNDVETTEYAAGLATAVSKVESAETITYLMGHGLMGLERSTDGAMFYYLVDGISSVRDIVRGTDGAVMASYEFSEYGERIATSESGVSSQKTFVGGMSVQDEVADTGLMLMGHRFYEPSGPSGGMGRFLNRDPIGFRGGLNLMEYGRSSPISFVDPAGLQTGVGDPDWNPITGQPEPNPFTSPNGVTHENVPALLEFGLGFNPFVGFGLSARDYSQDPSGWNLGMLALSSLGLRSLAVASKGSRSAIGLRRVGERGTFNGRLFYNHFPERLNCELANAQAAGVSVIKAGTAAFQKLVNDGTIKWAVTESGELVAVPHTSKGIEISHAVLTNGGPVRTAGQADIAALESMMIGIDINNHSGHFQPTLESMESIGKAAFSALGINFK